MKVNDLEWKRERENLENIYSPVLHNNSKYVDCDDD